MSSSEDYCPDCGFMLSKDSSGADFCLVCRYGKKNSSPTSARVDSSNDEKEQQQPSPPHSTNLSPKFCNYCGAALTDAEREATFCPNCGKPLTTASAEAAIIVSEERSAPEVSLSSTSRNTSETKEIDQTDFQKNAFPRSTPTESRSSQVIASHVGALATSKDMQYNRKSHAGRNIVIFAVLIIVAMVALIFL